jgi:GTPase Era involved in 16S rRNA processing
MARRTSTLGSQLVALQTTLESLRPRIGSAGAVLRAIDRIRADAGAIRHHLGRDDCTRPMILAILGGTGTGKSTLVNRLLESNLTATSFRRTFTAGAIALARSASDLPGHWLGVEHEVIDPAALPARGRAEALAIIEVDHALTRHVVFIDTPDLDGDQPQHHAQADRVFRWADSVLFLVTPEKYQMTELRPYYRLASRYEVPAMFVMNKLEEQAVLDDYQRQIDAERAYALPRDDSPYQAPAPQNLDALRTSIEQLAPADQESRQRGIANRSADLIDRLRDQVLQPLRDERREADRMIDSLRAMEAPPPGVDVNPLTQQLQRRLQQRSVLYLMGPGRMLDRVRQVPAILARLPRTTWDLLRTGQLSRNGADDLPKDWDQGVPNFRAALVDQFTIVQSRIEDLLRSSAVGQNWLGQRADQYAAAKLNTSEAARIADEELAALREWLEKHWNATPRDTAVLMKLMKYLPGGEQLTRWSESAPYLLAIVVATHGAFFGPIDLLVIGGFSLATWLTEKLSNQVASRARATNTAIAHRFTALAHQQIDRVIQWLDRQAPTTRELDQLQRVADDISEATEPARVR